MVARTPNQIVFQPPAGLLYRKEVLTITEEKRLLAILSTLPFEEVRMHGVVAKRRVIHYGWGYAYDSRSIEPTASIPAYLLDVREKLAKVAQLDPATLEEVLISYYPPGAGIGWHRDAPSFHTVVGVSLGADTVMAFRLPQRNQRLIYKQVLEPRSVYVLSGDVRNLWQHTIPKCEEPRYSITFRTLRPGARGLQELPLELY